jgi:hypothetical protein
MRYRCAWCGKKIGPKQEIIAPLEGKRIEVGIPSAGRNVEVLVTTAESQARKEGWDLIAMTCSERCGHELKDAFLADGVPNAKAK